MGDKNIKIQFIGCGKMGEVILQNLLEFEKSENIFVETKTDKTKEKLKNKYNINIGINKNALIIFLLIKPQQFDELNFESFGKNKIIFSFVAGLKSEKIAENFRTKKIIRAMPNTPMLVGKGVIGYYVFGNIGKYLDYFIKIFSKKSSLIKCEIEDKIDKVTALSGSGPAYFYFITEIIKQKALEFGFSVNESEKIVNNTFIGAGKLLEKSGEKLEKLRENITSKGGTTQKAIEIFKKNNLAGKIYEGIDGAYEKAKSL